MKESRVAKSEYRKFVKGLALNEMKMTSMKAAVEKNFEPPASITIKDKADYEAVGDNKMEVSHAYTLEGTMKGADVPGFSLEVHYVLYYSAKTPVTKEYFAIFAKSSLRLQTWPYFRQCVHQMTLNMNLPPLVLNTIQLPA